MLQTLEEYLAELMPSAWMNQFWDIRRRWKSKAISETQYYDAISDLVCKKTSHETMSRLNQSLQEDFNMRGCVFSHHFIARLLARFPGSTVDFLMTTVRRLKASCCKRKKERGHADGITLVMDPRRQMLITVFAH